MRRLVVIGLGVLLAACGSPGTTPGGGSANISAPTVATLSPSVIASSPRAGGSLDVTASASPALPAGGWRSLRWTAPVLGTPYETISDVVGLADGYVAVGQLQNRDGGIQAAAWFSTDWRTWTRTLLDVPRVGDSTLNRVLAIGQRLVAIGSSGALHCVPPEGEGLVCDPLPIAEWTSTDGRTWQRAATPPAMAGVTISAVAADTERLVLAGGTSWDEPGIWTTLEGVTWQRETLPTSTFAKARFFGLAFTGDRWVLTGATGGTEPICCDASIGATTPSAWFSPDGVTWEPATVDGASMTGRVLDGSSSGETAYWRPALTIRRPGGRRRMVGTGALTESLPVARACRSLRGRPTARGSSASATPEAITWSCGYRPMGCRGCR